MFTVSLLREASSHVPVLNALPFLKHLKLRSHKKNIRSHVDLVAAFDRQCETYVSADERHPTRKMKDWTCLSRLATRLRSESPISPPRAKLQLGAPGKILPTYFCLVLGVAL
jgi:hypothetical protein